MAAAMLLAVMRYRRRAWTTAEAMPFSDAESQSSLDARAVALAVDRLLGHPWSDAGVVDEFDDDPDPIVG